MFTANKKGYYYYVGRYYYAVFSSCNNTAVKMVCIPE